MKRTLIFLVAAISIGCSARRDPPALIEGRVVSKGRPVTKAVIYFEKENDDYSVFAHLDAEGRFQMKTFDYGGLPEGTYRIAIKSDLSEGTALAGDARNATAHPLIPAAFMKIETSRLKVDLKKGTNPPLLFELSKTP